MRKPTHLLADLVRRLLVLRRWYFAGLFFFFPLFQNLLAQCPSGDLVLSTQQSIDNWISDYPGCTELSGSLIISGADILDVSNLGGIAQIEGDLIIEDNSQLATLGEWFDRVIVLGEVRIATNPALAPCNQLGICRLLEMSSDITIDNNDPSCGDLDAVIAHCALANCGCPDLINVTLDDKCTYLLTGEDVAVGPRYCDTAATVLIDDGTPNGNRIDGPGRHNYVLLNTSGEAICFGQVQAEDKTTPVFDRLVSDPSADSLICTDIDRVFNNPATIDPASPFFLGRPFFRDNCTPEAVLDSRLRFFDEITYFDCTQGGLFARLTRTFFTEDEGNNSDGEPASSSYSVKYDFRIPDLRTDLVQGPVHDTIQTCTPFDTKVPAPKLAVRNGFGEMVFLENLCNYSVSLTTSESTQCDGRIRKISQEIEVVDWCQVTGQNRLTLGATTWAIGDFAGPAVQLPGDTALVSTDPFGCTASFHVRSLERWGVNISDCPQAEVAVNLSVYGWVDEVVFGVPTGNKIYRRIAGSDLNGVVTDVPVGLYDLIVQTSDGCKGVSSDTLAFRVQDLIGPTMRCANEFNISVSAEGYGRIYPEDLDENSTDNCSEAIDLKIRRSVPGGCLSVFLDNGYDTNEDGRIDQADGWVFRNGQWFTPYSGFVEVFCCDVTHTITVELQGRDDAQYPFYRYDRNGEVIRDANGTPICFFDPEPNTNTCWVDVRIEDKTIPECSAPNDTLLFCTDPLSEINFFEREELAAAFGEPDPSGSGELAYCSIIINELTPQVDLDPCGVGTLTRRFEPVNTRTGQRGPICTQTITFAERNQYAIRFPADAEQICGDPFVDTLVYVENACDLLAISVLDDTFSTNGDECFKVHRLYTIINWCEYDGFYPEDPWNLFRDYDNNGTAGDRAFWLIRYADVLDKPDYADFDDTDGDGRDRVFGDGSIGNEQPDLDLNDDDRYIPLVVFSDDLQTIYTDEPIDKLEPQFTDLPDLADEAYWTKGYTPGSLGYYRYLQVIKVYDDTRPLIQADTLEVCSFNNDTLNDCTGLLELPVRVEDECTTGGSISVGIDAFNLDELTPLDQFQAGSVIGSWPNFVIQGRFPLGEHSAVVTARDDCGNFSIRRIPFRVVDCKAPAPICVEGLAIELMPRENTDTLGTGAMALWASDFITSPVFDCSGQGENGLITDYSINLVEDPLGLGRDSVNRNQTGLTFYCADLGTVRVEVHAWDEAGNHSYCETYLLVQDNMGTCNAAPVGNHIAGKIATEEQKSFAGVEVRLSGRQSMTYITDETGNYGFEGLEEGYDYTVSPFFDLNHPNGVSTYDIVVITRHILGIQQIASPYKIIAADVNNSRSVTTFDLVQLRKVILRVEAKFSNNTSWRFVNADYVFPKPSDPWAEPFPEVRNYNDLLSDQEGGDFIAIKVGDINGSAVNVGGEAQSRANQTPPIWLPVEDRVFLPGEAAWVAIGQPEEKVIGLQGTLELDTSRLQFLDWRSEVLSLSHVGLIHSCQGRIPLSWDTSPAGEDAVDGPLLWVKVAAKQATYLHEAIVWNSVLTPAEAYRPSTREEIRAPLDLQFVPSSSPIFHGKVTHYPNPFTDWANISFCLEKKGPVHFQVFDASGRVLHQQLIHLSSGQQTLRLPAIVSTWPTGAYFYTLEAAGQRHLGKIVRVDS